MKPEWFAHGQGMGYIADGKHALPVKPRSFQLAGELIAPGYSTTLSGHFCRPLEFLGALEPKEMIFYIGSDGDLFREKHYFQSVLWVSETRIFESFKPGSGRDFNFIGGRWK